MSIRETGNNDQYSDDREQKQEVAFSWPEVYGWLKPSRGIKCVFSIKGNNGRFSSWPTYTNNIRGKMKEMRLGGVLILYIPLKAARNREK